MTAPTTVSAVDLPVLLAGAPPELLERTMLAVAAMHEPDDHGRCRVCRPRRRRWWRHGTAPACPTRRMLVAAVTIRPPSPRYTPV